MKPNLLKIMQHFGSDRILGVADGAPLWTHNAVLLHVTSVAAHAFFASGKMFAGSFDEVMASPLLRKCFMDCFVPSAREMSREALFLALGPCPAAALGWCVQRGVLKRAQVLGAFCHPATSGGSTVKYYLRGISRQELKLSDPMRHRTGRLDQAYTQMRSATAFRLGAGAATISAASAPMQKAIPIATKSASPKTPTTKNPRAEKACHADLTAILESIRKAGYGMTRSIDKVAEFQSPSGQTIYIEKKTSRPNRIHTVDHPEHHPETVRQLPGVEEVGDQDFFTRT